MTIFPRQTMTAALLAFALVLTAAARTVAETEPPAAEEEEGNDRPASLDDLLNLPAQPSADDADDEPTDSDPGDTDADEIDLDSISNPQSSDPFAEAVAEMKVAAERLGGNDAGLDTQRVQERVISRLDQMIDQLREQQQSSSSQQQAQQQDTGSEQNESRSQQASSGQDEADSTEGAQQAGRRGEVRDGARNEEAMNEERAEWGNLPPHLRDELLQGREDRFSDLYRPLTERYYQRLAEETP